ncbi:DUF5683 domain-containing protein [Pedobacter insulae]|uniref:DUF5683 domain-containing protein n=1 Tax=Pedobacter insulae TaxID=414048 RepID=A0A1I2ZL78_9SPHI|nr:DUF5683 domain-containing protein [Pedobacter insulae]SFH38632.1 hypothetical protein SAMN04489864_110124 [Pedobacter insulae]
MRLLYIFLCIFLTFTTAKAQDPVKEKSIEVDKAKTDTIAPSGYINKGRIAGKIAIRRSLIIPGWGQAYNYKLVVDDVKSGQIAGKGIGKKMAIVGKIAGIYVAGTMLTLSFIENNRNYNLFLKELQYRQANGNQPDPDGSLKDYKDTDALYKGKAIYKNNKEVVLISLGVVYGINVIDAYVTARLKYLNVEEKLGFNINPTIINSNTMYGYNSITPALKLTLKL